MNNEAYIDKLKHLISICYDGQQGYMKAAENTHSSDLKSKFTCYATEREGFIKQLEEQIVKLGGTCDEVPSSGGVLGSLHRAWMDIKTALTAEDDKAILETCKNGDHAAVEAYDEALQGTILNSDELKLMLTTQRGEIADTYNEVEHLYLKEFDN